MKVTKENEGVNNNYNPFDEINNRLSRIEAQIDQTDKSEEELLSRKKAAEFLNITLPTLNSWTSDGTLQSYRLGGRVYYKKNEIIYTLKPRN